jgi:hypothetical protein
MIVYTVNRLSEGVAGDATNAPYPEIDEELAAGE